ncbi:CRISPR-associated protein Cas4 [Paenibacillus hunanensis]|uniref:CRISPR-associated exonuclease Cas4 n=1 Tax=Paenibacillus hunanensis TaxID=539262 RepID=A0ABU1IWK3_9BACL|nr:CRISPR-associated protein Cas4 [Paenibacillus hunanensis]MDR6243613.1 CRISPR-associated exonuclease Cas4 [Paenibacillus hunanensis]GGJ23377.1 CRISPR-associated protein Cas4 [Paenibacillus hunanensis]
MSIFSLYDDDELLMLSGIQHYSFCQRQWALIHIEQQWEENIKTFEGQLLHKRADNPELTEKRGNLLISRAMPLVSRRLGISGKADVIEFHAADADYSSTLATPLIGRRGRWIPFPVEYKRGKPKPDDWDEVQLCAQAMCLEEMFGIRIVEGALFYGERERRVDVEFNDGLRGRVEQYLNGMRELFNLGKTPPARYKAGCKSCSLIHICMPKMRNSNVDQYMENYLDDE